MMNPETVFQIANLTAFLGWIFLILGNSWSRRFPMMRLAQPAMISLALSLALCLVYTLGIAMHFQMRDLQDFNTLGGLQRLFMKPEWLTLGWVHYLALDLAIGCWISLDAKKHNIASWLVSPILALTFLLAPIGFGIYMMIRLIKPKSLGA